MTDPDLAQAAALMEGYAQRTGLISGQRPRRYLWTDAFAVCNLLGLAQATGQQRYTQLALRLVEQTHHTLGRHRADAARSGWLSGLNEAEGEQHPTQGGLRIGKAMPERGPGDRLDERLEWERDGQYFHYLTKWMHALDQVTRATGEPRFNSWARELAAAADQAFTYRPAGSRKLRMYWKMSIDLSRPLVASMGQHDPLDGYVTVMQLRATAAQLPRPVGGPRLDDSAQRFATMLADSELTTPDPLGIGGLLIEAYRVAQLLHHEAMPNRGLLEQLLSAALAGLQHYASSGELQAPAEYRLAFRELGLAIGLHAVHHLEQQAARDPLSLSPATRTRLEALLRYAPLGDTIKAFWREPRQQRVSTWAEHRDINEVMLATSLAPAGFLELSVPAASE
jgi:hypothetical protein